MTRSEDVVTVGLPLRVWGRLATEAEHRGVTVADVLVNAINQVIRPEGRREAVVGACRAGFTDREIAEQTGETRSYVQSVRKAVGLPANRDRGQRRSHV